MFLALKVVCDYCILFAWLKIEHNCCDSLASVILLMHICILQKLLSKIVYRFHWESNKVTQKLLHCSVKLDINTITMLLDFYENNQLFWGLFSSRLIMHSLNSADLMLIMPLLRLIIDEGHQSFVFLEKCPQVNMKSQFAIHFSSVMWHFEVKQDTVGKIKVGIILFYPLQHIW